MDYNMDYNITWTITWTIARHDGPNHLGLWHKCAPRASNGLTTSDQVRGGVVKRISYLCPFEDCEYTSPGTGHLFRHLRVHVRESQTEWNPYGQSLLL